MSSPSRRIWNVQEGQARQHRAILLVLAISFVAGIVCLVADGPSQKLAELLAGWVPAIEKLLSPPLPGSGTLAAKVAAVNVALLPLYVALLAYRQNFAARFRHGARGGGWGPVKATLIAYLVIGPFFLLLLLLFFVAPFETPAQPRLWGQQLLALLLGSPVGLLALMPALAVALSLLAYGLAFLCWLPFSFLFNRLKGDIQ